MGQLVPAMDLRPANEPAKAPPANIDAEQALLGCLLYDNGAFERLPDGLRGKHFYEPFHARMFDVVEALLRVGQLAEPIIVADRLQSDPAFEELGGLRYLADLVDRAPPAANAPDYARLVYETAQRREALTIMADGHAELLKSDVPAQATLEQVENQLFALAEPASSGGLQTFEHFVTGAVSMAAQAFERDGSLTGLSTGLIDLDQRTGGLHPSDLIVLAGRPSMGKTALATNIAFHVAKSYAYEPMPDGSRRTTNGGRVAFFSLEMSGEQLALRILAEVSGVSGDRIRKGQIEAHEFGRIRDAALQIQTIPLHIDPTGSISIAKLGARARRLKRLHGLDLIIVDYLQLAQGSKKYEGGQRVQEVSEITVGLKALAKDLGVPVIALSQLSRQVENREDKKPQLSDLRESGSIEQDADMVMFVYRESYYLGRTEPKEGSDEHYRWTEQMDQVRGLAEVIIGKQRHGPIGSVKLAFNEEITKFGNLARGGRHEYGAQRLAYAEQDDD